jgi:hypothetical protein
MQKGTSKVNGSKIKAQAHFVKSQITISSLIVDCIFMQFIIFFPRKVIKL